jgi:hypothetical protein
MRPAREIGDYVKTLRWLVVLLILASCARGQIDQLTSGEGALVGRAVDATGAPVAGVRVILLGAARAETATGADGRFAIGEAPAGKATLVLNDGQGHGHLRELSIYPHGTNDAGDTFLEDLTRFPEMVLLRDVGFEERISSAPGDLGTAVYSSDGSMAYGVRAAIDAAPTLVAISTADGSETPLGNSPAAPDLDLLADRYLLLRYTVPDLKGGPDVPWMAVVNLTTGNWLHGESATVLDWWRGSADLFFILRKPSGALYVHTLLRIGLGGNAHTEVGVLPAGVDGHDASSDLPVLVAHDDERVVFVVRHGCSAQPDAECDADRQANPYAIDVYALDVASGASSMVATVRHGDNGLRTYNRGRDASEATYDPVGHQLYLIREDLPDPTDPVRLTATHLTRLDVPQGTATDLLTTASGDPTLVWFIEGAGPGAFFLARLVLHDNVYQWVSYARFDLASGKLTDVPGIYTVPGLELHFCGVQDFRAPLPFFPFNCTMGVAPSGATRLNAMIFFDTNYHQPPAGLGQITATIVDVDENGVEQRRRAFPYRIAQVPQLTTSRDGAHEAVLLRGGGFDQVWVASTQSPHAPFARATFLPSDHSRLGTSSDGSWLYLARDPLSGYVQLFRMAPR